MPLNPKVTQDQCNNNFSAHYGQFDKMVFFEGSGGGSVSQSLTGGSGGGIIYLEANQLDFYGSLNSMGQNATTQTDSGGGAGGSIFVATYTLKGSGTFDITGGSAAQGFKGGAGSGGRIIVVRLNWSDSTYFRTQTVADKFQVRHEGGVSQIGDGRKGSVFSSPCPLGYAGFTCKMCPVGYYSDNFFDDDCKPCTNKLAGANGQYINTTSGPQQNSNCPYKCIDGITRVSENPYCLPNFELFLKNIGGPYVMALVVLATLILIVMIICIVFRKTKNHKPSINKLISRAERVAKGNLQEEDNNRDSVASYGSVDNLDYVGNVLHQIHQRNLQFFDRDIYQHVSRVYFLGHNTYHLPWKMPLNPPSILKPKILSESYMKFAADLNRFTEWKKNDNYLYNLLRFFYPPAADIFRYFRRKHYVRKFIHKLYNSIQITPFWKEEEDRMRDNIQIKLGVSKQLQLCFLDFLDTRMDPHMYEGIQYPFTILLSGVGSFENPFYLDFDNDPLIKQLGRVCGEKVWKKFIDNLNSQFWTVQLYSYNWMLKNNILRILNFIEIMNSRLFEPVCGFKAQLYIMEIETHVDEGFIDYRMGSMISEGETLPMKYTTRENIYHLEKQYIKKKQTLFYKFLNYWRHTTSFNYSKEFKLAIVFHKYSKTGGQYQATLSTKRGRSIHQRLSFSENSQDLSVLSDNRAEDDNLENYELLQFVVSEVRKDHLDKEWLRTFKQVPVLETCTEKTKQWFRQAYIRICQLSQIVSYRHRLPVLAKFSQLSLIAYVCLVMTDVVLTIELLIKFSNNNLEQDKDSIYLSPVLFASFFPLVSIISPIFGILSMITCKTKLYQYHSFFNHISMFCNTLALIINNLVQNTIQFDFLIGCLLFLNKLLLSQVITQQISYFLNPKYDKNMAYLEEHFIGSSNMEKQKTLIRGRVQNSEDESPSGSPVQSERKKVVRVHKHLSEQKLDRMSDSETSGIIETKDKHFVGSLPVDTDYFNNNMMQSEGSANKGFNTNAASFEDKEKKFLSHGKTQSHDDDIFLGIHEKSETFNY